MDLLVRTLLATLHEVIRTRGQPMFNFEHKLLIQRVTSSLKLELCGRIVDGRNYVPPGNSFQPSPDADLTSLEVSYIYNYCCLSFAFFPHMALRIPVTYMYCYYSAHMLLR
jgi:hypothetical protein